MSKPILWTNLTEGGENHFQDKRMHRLSAFVSTLEGTENSNQV
jgi:hypothetical protein